jgi:hypothetical protein|tara:strand:+ start:5167 stop:5442 length:276 start_codon:yes stop_codon:yes gene_type:complete
MESTSTIYEILAASWLSGALLAWWQLFLPSMKIIRILEPDNLVVRFQWLCGTIFFFFSLVFFPFLISVILDDSRKERFMQGFIPALLGKNE